MIKNKQTIKVLTMEILNHNHLIMSLEPENHIIQNVYRSINNLVQVLLEEIEA